jgi:hypothetical protein
MTTEASIDDIRGWFEMLCDATDDRREAEERIKVAREKIEEAIGDRDVATIDGVPVVKWVTIESRRFDASLAKAMLTTAQIAAATVVVTTRPFRILES